MGYRTQEDIFNAAKKYTTMFGHGEIVLEHLTLMLVEQSSELNRILEKESLERGNVALDPSVVLVSLIGSLEKRDDIRFAYETKRPTPRQPVIMAARWALAVADMKGKAEVDLMTLLFAVLDSATHENKFEQAIKSAIMRDPVTKMAFDDFLETKKTIEQNNPQALPQPDRFKPATGPVRIPVNNGGTVVYPPVTRREPYIVKVPGGSMLASFGTNLNQRALDGKIDKLIGRQDEIEKTIHVLGRRKKRNPLLVGEPGVGKTAIAEGLARKMVEGDVPESLQRKNIFTLDLGALVAGTKYRGEFEERMKRLIEEMKRQKDVIVFIDEIHTIIGAGSAEGNNMDVSNMLKPALADGSIQCIGATTPKEKKKLLKDAAQARRWGEIFIGETDAEATRQIIEGIKGDYEKHHNVTYTAEALDAAVKLAARFIHNNHFPDKAIDVIDEAASVVKARAKAQGMVGKPEVHVADIEEVVASIAHIPSRNVRSGEKEALKNLEEDLKAVVFDQDPAITRLVRSIRTSRSGLGEANKPVGSFIFKGPTGVGKTEVTTRLAETLGMKFLRLDMSEYMEQHAIARLIGAPPGYVGHEDGGQLTEFVRNNPHCVILLDEIEKAHKDISNVLLQILDGARLTDGEGRTVRFDNTILIMTSNLGTTHEGKGPTGINIGGSSGSGAHDVDPRDDKALREHFRPELLNRIDAIVEFKPLQPTTMEKMVAKFLKELETQMAEKKASITLTDEAKSYLGQKGYSKILGARPLKRVFREELREPLAEQLLYGELQEGGEVTVDVEKDDKGRKRLRFTFNKVAKDDEDKKAAAQAAPSGNGKGGSAPDTQGPSPAP